MDKEFKQLLKSWEGKKGNVIPLLQETQVLYGYLPKEAIAEIAGTTIKSPAEIYGVATFYAQFRFLPQGKHMMKVCHGTACHVSGADSLDIVLQKELEVVPGETTRDGMFSVDRVACLGCCSLAPVVMIDQEVYGRLTGDKLIKTLKKIIQ
ncbi:MAG: NADH-quinone oxidoreductase subunit NuoE [Spirochaeta sp.]|nr:NADH-quinone oxidoreductase subunit NuoE [Spirochaeta sp.]